MSLVGAAGADTPGRAMSLLERRATATIVGILIALAGMAWYVTVRQSLAMTGMVTGLGQVGGPMGNEVGAPLFMLMWLTMMVAMMFPTIAPMVLAHRMVVRNREEGYLPTMAFVGGYLAVWTAIGVVPLAAFLGFRNLPMETGGATWSRLLAAGILVIGGAYQFTPWKRVCLKACRTPLGFIMTHDFGAGSPGAFRAGISHGAYCLGCCWALMALLVVVGLMNLVWMVIVALIFLAEKNWRHGVLLTRVVGPTMVLLGVGLAVAPDALAWLTGGQLPATRSAHM